MARIQPRGWLAAATSEQGLFIDTGAEPPPPTGSRAHHLWTLALWVPVTPPGAGPGPGRRAHTDPHSTPLSAHTLSRLWAWVRGDSSCSTRRSWGAARESITATPPDPDGAFGPQTGSGRRGPDVPEGLRRGSASGPCSRSRFRDTGAEAGKPDVAHPGCRRPRRPCEPSPCLCGPALRRAASQPQPAPLCTRTRGGAPRRTAPRCRRETVAWKLGRGRSHPKAAGRAGPSPGVGGRGEDGEPHCPTRGLRPGVGTTGVKGGKVGAGRRSLWPLRPAPPEVRAASVRQRAPKAAPGPHAHPRGTGACTLLSSQTPPESRRRCHSVRTTHRRTPPDTAPSPPPEAEPPLPLVGACLCVLGAT